MTRFSPFIRPQISKIPKKSMSRKSGDQVMIFSCYFYISRSKTLKTGINVGCLSNFIIMLSLWFDILIIFINMFANLYNLLI
ncbi:hypothetical protein BGS_0211 [Beggiatoa sp. SS]|nr:hypothetical protein BGS_0211 [Beggiatoa sp. SS]